MSRVEVVPDRSNHRFEVVATREHGDPIIAFWFPDNEQYRPSRVVNHYWGGFKSRKRAERVARRWRRKIARQERRERQRHAEFEAQLGP